MHTLRLPVSFLTTANYHATPAPVAPNSVLWLAHPILGLFLGLLPQPFTGDSGAPILLLKAKTMSLQMREPPCQPEGPSDMLHL